MTIKLGYKMKLILATIFIFISSTILAYNTTQARDSLLSLLKTSNNPQQKIQTYRNLADIFMDTDASKYKTSLWKMYQEASKVKDKKSMLEALNDIIIEEAKSDQKDSIVKYTEYLKQIASPQEIKYLLPFYHMRLFDSMCYSNKKTEAIEEELSFLDSKTNDPNDIYKKIVSTYVIGNSFYMSDQSEKAVPYLDKAMKLTESLPEKEKYIYQRFIIWRQCFAYAQSGRNKESAKIMEQLINLVEQKYKTDYEKQRPFYSINLDLLQYYSFMIASLPYLTLEQEDYYWKRTQKIGKELTNDNDRYSYYHCANNYYANNRTKRDFPKALAANDTLIKISRKLAPRNLPGLYNISSQIHEMSKDYRNALKYLKISYHMQDSLNTEAANKQLNELQVKYDVNTLSNEKTMLEMKNKQMLLISLSILLIILISISTYFYFSWKKEKRMKMQLKVLHGKAQESEKMKQEFINSICHEIRTPLNAIVGFSDLIMNEDIDIEMRKEFPDEIQRSTHLLTDLVNSMLEVANLDVSEEKLPCASTDIFSVCLQVMERHRTKADIDYRLEISEDSTFIHTNEHYLSQVIEHLLSNANKFTKEGQITLGYQIDETAKKITIYVSDTGCGIPVERREQIFDRFYKLDTFVPGNGLGLYLCQLIVKRLQGEIKIDPEYTEGTRMIVVLPID